MLNINPAPSCDAIVIQEKQRPSSIHSFIRPLQQPNLTAAKSPNPETPTHKLPTPLVALSLAAATMLCQQKVCGKLKSVQNQTECKDIFTEFSVLGFWKAFTLQNGEIWGSIVLFPSFLAHYFSVPRNQKWQLEKEFELAAVKHVRYTQLYKMLWPLALAPAVTIASVFSNVLSTHRWSTVLCRGGGRTPLVTTGSKWG